jgi:hypothetical protein
MAKHTTCRYCGLDIENLWPYRNGEWRDRGNNTHCNDMLKFEEGDKAHAPYKPTRRLVGGIWREFPVDGCRWFAGCKRAATGTTPHPVLGDVPTCDKCHKFATS